MFLFNVVYNKLVTDYYLLSTDHEIISYVHLKDGHAQDFAVNGDLPLLILQAFAQYNRLLHATRNAQCFQSVFGNRSLSLPNQSSSPTYSQQSHAPHQTRPLTPQLWVSFRGQWSAPTLYQQLKIDNRGNNKYFMLQMDET
jgi:hypothetical protein